MLFRELIKRVQHHSGFSDSESKDALELMVGGLAERLNEDEREDFASQLPPELQDVALAAPPAEQTSGQDLLQEFMEAQDIEEGHAKKQIMAAWTALKEAISPGEIDDIKAQLPKATAAFLP